MGIEILRLSNGCLLIALLGLCVLGCGARPDGVADSSRKRAPAGVAQDENLGEPLILLAAASTKDAVEELAALFEKQTGTRVLVSSGPSNALATQITAGAPADLFLPANEKWALYVKEQGLAAEATPLLTNGLALIVPRGNRAQVRSPTDLAGRRVKRVALAGENVPAGIYAEQALRELGLYDLLIEADKIVRGQDARVTLSYVARGEVEAGIVYDTDARIEKNVIVVDRFDPKSYDPIVYALVQIKRERANPAAQKLFEFFCSAEAATVFERFGFQRMLGEKR
jgi:molybdate transport system substrate-binding protein